MRKIIVTGGAGFIGSAFVRRAVKEGYTVTVIDSLTYAGDLMRLQEVKGRYAFYKHDICDSKKINAIFKKVLPESVINFAAESHVDRSIQNATPFLETNVLGVQILADASRMCEIKKFIHISTDEVYGDILSGAFNESSVLSPSSPYSASKAAADLLLKSYIRTYGFPAVIIRPCNNYGPWQYPEKLVPLAILKVLKREKVPVYADGKNVREWLYVEDCADAIIKILKRGKTGEIYNIGSNEELRNIDMVKLILRNLDVDDSFFTFVKDRPGHDKRYKLNSSKVMKQIRWRAKTTVAEGIKNSVAWNKGHRLWLLSKYKSIVSLYKT